MRIRQVKPAFWTDKEMGRLPPSVRLDYIGLWMLADDAGWIEAFDVEQAAAELYPWESIGRRGRRFVASVSALAATGRVVIHESCGCLEVPHLMEHQRIAGKRSLAGQEAHRAHVAKLAIGKQSVDKLAQVGNGRERNVEERNGREILQNSPSEGSPSSGDGALKAALVANGLHLGKAPA